MDADVRRACVTGARVARLATVTSDSRPHAVPCCFALDPSSDVVYTAVDDVKPKSTLALRRLENLRSHPWVSLLVDHYSDDWTELWWVRLDGRARVLDVDADRSDTAERTRGLDLLSAKYDQYRRHRPPGAVIAVDVETWRSWPH